MQIVEILNVQSSKDEYGLSVGVEQPLVQGEEEHEAEEEADGGEEVPNVVIVVKSKYLAVLVRVPGLGR